ncbi:MAG TPA: hypothetical protein VM452_18905 [Caulifigura sp.]|jgi:hypothetical protein|nr:hypothetical protein [Caulifigura sp.]
MLRTLLNDDDGFIVSAELILIATLLVIGLIVGMAEVQHAVNAELNDVADAIGDINQSYFYSGFHKIDIGVFHALSVGSFNTDREDSRDGKSTRGEDMACDAPVREGLRGLP